MRISDWSSDVCSSDLVVGRARGPGDAQPAGIAFDRVEEGRRRLREAEGMVARRPAEGVEQRCRITHAARHRMEGGEAGPGLAGEIAPAARLQAEDAAAGRRDADRAADRKSTRLNSSN